MYRDSGKNGTDESIFRAGMKTKTYIMDLRAQWGKEKRGQMENVALTCALSWGNRRLAGSCCVTQGAQLCAL